MCSQAQETTEVVGQAQRGWGWGVGGGGARGRLQLATECQKWEVGEGQAGWRAGLASRRMLVFLEGGGKQQERCKQGHPAWVCSALFRARAPASRRVQAGGRQLCSCTPEGVGFLCGSGMGRAKRACVCVCVCVFVCVCVCVCVWCWGSMQSLVQLAQPYLAWAAGRKNGAHAQGFVCCVCCRWLFTA